MALKCKKCGMTLNKYHLLEITDDEQGYRCKACATIHSWIDGSITQSETQHKQILESVFKKEVKQLSKKRN